MIRGVKEVNKYLLYTTCPEGGVQFMIPMECTPEQFKEAVLVFVRTGGRSFMPIGVLCPTQPEVKNEQRAEPHIVAMEGHMEHRDRLMAAMIAAEGGTQRHSMATHLPRTLELPKKKQ